MTEEKEPGDVAESKAQTKTTSGDTTGVYPNATGITEIAMGVTEDICTFKVPLNYVLLGSYYDENNEEQSIQGLDSTMTTMEEAMSEGGFSTGKHLACFSMASLEADGTGINVDTYVPDEITWDEFKSYYPEAKSIGNASVPALLYHVEAFNGQAVAVALNIAKKTFRLYLIYACILTATAFLDYVIDTWYLQNLAIFFSSMIISVNHMIQVSDQWLDAKRELLISEYRASHDIMTGLWNKTSGVDQVINCLENMSESDMAVLGFMDIDNFKSVNDTYGHETGVFWIREVATALQEMCGPSDIACRYGGDEYILFLQNIGDREELTARIEGFRKKIHDKAEEKGQDVHCSIGLYRVKGAGRKLAECIMISDGLLYQAKKNGKDTYVIE